ncbi:hypothetical protein V8B97DRAFT_1847761, partial [Scleroderma yunnanense]
LSFIDDICLLARGPSFTTSNQKLELIMECPGSCIEWRKTHHIVFKINKTTLVQATHRRQESETAHRKTVPTKHILIIITGHTIQPSQSHKFLGIIINE